MAEKTERFEKIQFTQMSRARMRRRYHADEKGEPLATKPCQNYERRGLVDAEGLALPGCEEYCRCGFSNARHKQGVPHDIPVK